MRIHRNGPEPGPKARTRRHGPRPTHAASRARAARRADPKHRLQGLGRAMRAQSRSTDVTARIMRIPNSAQNDPEQQKSHIGLENSARFQSHLVHEFAARAKRPGNQNPADRRRADRREAERRVGSRKSARSRRTRRSKALRRLRQWPPPNRRQRACACRRAAAGTPSRARRQGPSPSAYRRPPIPPKRQNRSKPPFARQ